MPPRPPRVLGDPGRPALRALDRRALRTAVLGWFAAHGRELAFRTGGRPDPWGILVAEVMAQQTQIARVEERWPAFVAAFPTPEAMAAASPADVIRAWRGLGYNRRALALHRAATAIVASGGAVPRDLAGLGALPGVGPYTARAVASVAFGQPVGAVDVNVRRVLGRIVVGDPARISPAALQAEADTVVDPRRPGTWTHALMDLGATLCRPVRPACGSCPARPWCTFAARGVDAAGVGGPAPRPRRATPFEGTSRWLRGRLVDRLREAPADAAVDLAGPHGGHSAEAVERALSALAREGLIELDARGGARLAGSGAVPAVPGSPVGHRATTAPGAPAELR